MNSEVSWDDPAFHDAICDDEDSIDLDTIPSLSTYHTGVDAVQYDSKGALRGLIRSHDGKVNVTQLDDARGIGEICYLKKIGKNVVLAKLNSERCEDPSHEATKVIFEIDESYKGIYRSYDGKIVVGIRDSGHLEIYDVETNNVKKRLCGSGLVESAAISPDYSVVALGVRESSCNELKLIHLENDCATVFYSDESAGAVAFSHNGKRVAALAGVYSIKEKKLLWKHGTLNPWSCVSFNGDNTLLAAGYSTNTTTIFDAQNGVRLYELWSGGEQVTFSPDNKQVVASGKDDGAVAARIWKISVLKKLYNAFSDEERKRLNKQLDDGRYPPEFEILGQIDRAMQSGSRVFNDGYDTEESFDCLPKPLQKAFRKYIGKEGCYYLSNNNEESVK